MDLVAPCVPRGKSFTIGAKRQHYVLSPLLIFFCCEFCEATIGLHLPSAQNRQVDLEFLADSGLIYQMFPPRDGDTRTQSNKFTTDWDNAGKNRQVKYLYGVAMCCMQASWHSNVLNIL